MTPMHMSDHERLMADIVAKPDDDAPREAHARVCEAQGSGRARLILIQVQAVRELTKAQTSRRDQKQEEECERLIDLMGLQWAGDLATWLPIQAADRSDRDSLICDHGFVRGFIEYLARLHTTYWSTVTVRV